MKNIQVKHGLCDSIIYLKHFLLKALTNYQTFAFLTAGFFTFARSWNLSKLHVLQCLFVNGSNKKQKRCRIILRFTKGETSSCLMTTKRTLGSSHQVLPTSCTLQKRPFSPLMSAHEENIPGHSFERKAYLFLLKIVFPIPTGRVGLE